MKKINFICIFIFCIWASLFATSKPVMVVSTFDAKDFSADDVEFVMNIFTSAFANLGLANIVDRSSFDKIKKELSFQESDWSDNNKVAELGKALNANQVVVGQIIKRRNRVILTVRILDVNTTTIVASNIGIVSDIDDFLDSMPSFCAELMAKAKNIEEFQDAKNVGETSSLNVAYDNGSAEGEYRIGSVGPGGGLVFYINTDGFEVYDGMGGKTICHYLEVTRENLHTSYWSPVNIGVGTETGLGYGKSNTHKIVNVFEDTYDISNHNCAAYKAYKYKNAKTKEGDWWLPSKDELGLLQKALFKDKEFRNILSKDIGGIGGFYWTSSENLSNEYAWAMRISIYRNSGRVYSKNWARWVVFVKAF